MIDVLIKLIIGFLCIIAVFKVMGTKEIAQATPIDFVFTILTTAIIGDMAIDTTFTIYDVLIVLLTIWIVFYGLGYLTRKNKAFNKLMKGEPLIIVENGKVVESTLQTERMTREELEIKLRLKGVFNINEVKIAYLEPNGEISILRI